MRPRPHLLRPAVRTTPAPAEEATSRGAEVPAAAAGLRRGQVDAVWQAVEALYATGLHPAVALHLRVGGHVLLDRAIGHAQGNAPGDGPEAARVAATPDHLYGLFSATKMVTAILLLQQVEAGTVRLDDRVCRFIPAFAAQGKDRITVRHVLTHSAGLTGMPTGMVDFAHLQDSRPVVEALCRMPLQGAPGVDVRYQAMASGFILGEVIRRAAGTDLNTLLHRGITGPLGLETLRYGAAPDHLSRVAQNAFTGLHPPAAVQQIFAQNAGIDLYGAVDLSNDPRFHSGPMPSANIVCTPRELGRLLECLRLGGTLDGAQVLRPDTVRALRTERTRLQIDSTFGFPVRYGLGFMLGGGRFSLFGLGTTGAFGHIGFTNVVVFTDPARDLVFVLLNTGKPFMHPGMLRWYWVMQRAALGLPRS